jgi:uncharacterized protein YcbX
VRVTELWRFPVKSMRGERLDRVGVTPDGLDGDRRWAVFDVESGFGLTGRREPQLLFAQARLVDGRVEITLPDGRVATDDAALSDWLGHPVELRAAADEGTRRYEVPLDFEEDDAWVAWEGPAGPFHDSTTARVSLVSAATLGAWEPVRFRTNVIVDGDGEDALVGTTIEIGSTRLDVQQQIDRCVMVTRPQPGIDRDLDVLRAIIRDRSGFLAVGALVGVPGELAVGDEVVSLPR